jgi:hypothetical protein
MFGHPIVGIQQLSVLILLNGFHHSMVSEGSLEEWFPSKVVE